MSLMAMQVHEARVHKAREILAAMKLHLTRQSFSCGDNNR